MIRLLVAELLDRGQPGLAKDGLAIGRPLLAGVATLRRAGELQAGDPEAGSGKPFGEEGHEGRAHAGADAVGQRKGHRAEAGPL